MPCQLKPAHEKQLHQIAQVQAWRCRVKPAVKRDRVSLERLPKGRLIGGNMNQTPPHQLFMEGGESGIIGLFSPDLTVLHGFNLSVDSPVGAPATQTPAREGASGKKAGVTGGLPRPLGAPWPARRPDPVRCRRYPLYAPRRPLRSSPGEYQG